MIYLSLPIGSIYGWGVYGKYITKELSSITDVKLITEQFDVNKAGDEFDYLFLMGKLADREIASGYIKETESPVLHAIDEERFLPWSVDLKGTPNAGYTFFERTNITESQVRNANSDFDIVITGSKWCEGVLRQKGVDRVATVVQGIDPQLFNAVDSENTLFKDRFVVFSGGKFELRKGQDIVLKAYKVLQERHKDTMLVYAWFNPFEKSIRSMAHSPYIKFFVPHNYRLLDQEKLVEQALRSEFLDLSRVIPLAPRFNSQMAKVYKNTDIGLFPNRCEGGTNLVLMEYMACGKPVVASYNTGHKDILTDYNCIKIEHMGTIEHSGEVWEDPSLDETIEHLEWAYQNRDKLKDIGFNAGRDLAKFTWKRTAQSFYNLLCHEHYT